MNEKNLVALVTLVGLGLSAIIMFRVYAGYGDIADIVRKALALLQFL